MKNQILYFSLSKGTLGSFLYLYFSLPQLLAPHSLQTLLLQFSPTSRLFIYLFTNSLNFFAEFFPSSSWVLGPVLFGFFCIAKGFSGKDVLSRN